MLLFFFKNLLNPKFPKNLLRPHNFFPKVIGRSDIISFFQGLKIRKHSLRINSLKAETDSDFHGCWEVRGYGDSSLAHKALTDLASMSQIWESCTFHGFLPNGKTDVHFTLKTLCFWTPN